jgi:hypothetical protein
MILTDLYTFEKLPDQKSKLRIDCVSSTQSYEPLEQLRNKAGDLFIYIGDNTYTKAGTTRKADLALSKSKHISSIYSPENNGLMYGDMNNTADAILLAVKGEYINGGYSVGTVIEMYIARGQRNNRSQLFNLFADGELNDEMEKLRSVTNLVTPDSKEIS